MECLVITPTEHLMLQDREGNRFLMLHVRMYIDTVADNMTYFVQNTVILFLGIILMNTQTTKCIKYFHYNSAAKIRMSLDEFYVSM